MNLPPLSAPEPASLFAAPGTYLFLSAAAAAAGIIQDRRDQALQLGLLILAGFLVLSSVVLRLARR